MRKFSKSLFYLILGCFAFYITSCNLDEVPLDVISDKIDVEIEIPNGMGLISGVISLSDDNLDLSEVKVFVMGQESYAVYTNALGEYNLFVDMDTEAVRSGTRNETENSDKYTVIKTTKDKKKGAKIDDVKVTKNEKKELPKTTLEVTGSISGQITLVGQSDHTGIDVFIPGTSYMAKTDKEGNFVISDLPQGEYSYVLAMRDSYQNIVWTNVNVGEEVSLIEPKTMKISTGISGSIEINSGIDYSRERTVQVEIDTGGSVGMMVSEDPLFEGMIYGSTYSDFEYTFSSDGEKTLYVKFRDQSGAETIFSDSILIIPDPKVSPIGPIGDISNSKPVFLWDEAVIPSVTYKLQVSEYSDFRTTLLDYSDITNTTKAVDSSLPTGKTLFWRVAVVDKFGEPSSWSLADVTITIPTVNPISPIGEVNISRPSFSWEEAILPNATYILEVSEYSDFSTTLVNITGIQTTTQVIETVLPMDKQLYWRVSAVDENGVQSSWSTSELIVRIPSVMPLSPTGEINHSKPTFTWEVSELGDVTYKLQVSEYSDFRTTIVDYSDIENTTKTVDVTLPTDSEIFWRVAVVDNAGLVSSWRTERVTITIPTVNTISPVGEVNISKPSFSWEESMLQNATYILEVSEYSDFSTKLVEITGIQTTTQVIETVLPMDKQLYWRVSAVDEHGVKSLWSTSELIVRIPSVTPLSPTGEINHSKPTFTWEQSILDNVTYKLQVSEDSDFRTTLIDYSNIDNANKIVDVTLPTDFTIFWRVAVVDNAGLVSSWRTERVTIIIPTVNTISPVGEVNISRPSFSWEESILQNATYILEVSEYSDFSTKLVEITGIQTTTQVIETVLPMDKQLYWRVSAVDEHGVKSLWSTSELIVRIPSVTPLEPTGEISNSKPTFSWEESILENVTYKLQVSEYSDFRSNLVEYTNLVNATKTVEVALPAATTIYWRVAVVDEGGLVSSWRTEEVTVTIPTVSTISPIGEVNNSKPSFIWEESNLPNATYNLEISQNSDFSTTLVEITGIQTTTQVIDTVLPMDEQLYWRVSVLDEHGVQSLWSTSELIVRIPAVNPLLPTGDISNSKPTFSWEESFLENVTYKLQVSEYSDFRSNLVDYSNLVNTTKTVDISLPAATTIYWRVAVVDEGGLVSAWSTEEVTVTIPTVTTISPIGEVNNSKPSFIWDASSLPNVTYNLEISQNSDFSTKLVDVTDIQATTQVINTVLPKDEQLYWRVSVVDENGAKSLWSTSELIVRIPSVNPSFPIGEINSSQPTFSWDESTLPNATYNLEVSEYSDFSTKLVELSGIQITTQVIDLVLPKDKQLYWRVSVVDEYEVQSAWSISELIVRIPSVTPLYPTGDISNSKPTFSWEESALGNVTYNFQVSTYADFRSNLVDFSNIENTSKTVDVALPTGSIFWRVAVVDSAGLISSWRTEEVTLTIPTVSAMSPIGEVNNSKPSFIWEESLLPNATYNFEISQQSDFSTSLVEITGIKSTTQNIDTVLPIDEQLYWRVSVVDENGVQSLWSTSELIARIPSVSTSYPIGEINDSKPTFSWEQSVLGNVTYNLQVSEYSDFNVLLVDKSNILATTQDIEVVLPIDKQLYWRVSVVDENSLVSSWSMQNFNVDIPPVDLSGPYSNSVGSDSKPLFTWDQSLLDRVKYRFQRATDYNFNNILEDVSDIAVTAFQPNIALIDEEINYWRVAVVDENGAQGGWSNFWSYTVDLPTVGLSSPYNDYYHSSTEAVNLEWYNADSTAYYELQVSNSSEFNNTYINAYGTSYNFYGYTENQTYYWRVRLVDANGSRGNWSGVRSFIIPPSNLGISIEVNIPDDSDVTFNSGTYDIEYGMDAWIYIENANAESYKWFLNSEQIDGYSWSEIYIGSDLAPGNYELSVVAVKSGLPFSSASMTLRVR